MTVLKQFDEGLFKGTVTDAKKQRARYLYHVVYEDGDSEDLNEKEFMKANNETAVDKDKGKSVDFVSDAEEEHSGGETEGSEYGLSDEDDIRHSKKKRCTVQHSKLKEKDTNNRGNNVDKEEETPQTKYKNPRSQSKQSSIWKPIQSNIQNLKVLSKPSSMWKLYSSWALKTV